MTIGGSAGGIRIVGECKSKKLIIVTTIIIEDTIVAPTGGKKAYDATMPRVARAILTIVEKTVFLLSLLTIGVEESALGLVTDAGELIFFLLKFFI